MDREESIVIAVKAMANQFYRYMNGVRDQLAEHYPEIVAITEVHGRIIEYLFDNLGKGPVYQKDIEREFTIRRSTATVILQRMEKAGAIVRKVSREDARMKEIVLTARAKKIHPVAHAAILKVEEQAKQGLSEKEIEVFLRVAKKITENIG